MLQVIRIQLQLCRKDLFPIVPLEVWADEETGLVAELAPSA